MRILLTGGSGFLARGIMHEWPQYDYVVYSRDEYKQDLCKRRYPRARYVLGDVKDYDRLCTAIRGCDCVIHTAAVKFIPEAEYNVNECISVNIEGTQNVLAACFANDVETVIGISTDKAVLPINVYGMTKALMERLFIEQARLDPDHHYALARYGNVIGSTGSVVPLFQRQLEQTGRITITDPDMTRYWISIAQAIHLIELAMEHNSGSIIVPKPKAMKLLDVAEAIAQGCHIEIVGPRVGEKRHEQLMHQQESVRARDNSYYYELLMDLVVGEPFLLSSNTPEGGWLEIDEFKELIVTAKGV